MALRPGLGQQLDCWEHIFPDKRRAPFAYCFLFLAFKITPFRLFTCSLFVSHITSDARRACVIFWSLLLAFF